MTEVSRGENLQRKGRAYRNGPCMTAWLARPSAAWSLGSLGPWHFLLSTSLPDAATVSWSGLRLSSLNLDRSPGCLLFVWTSFFSLIFLSFSTSFSDGATLTFSPSGLRLSSLNLHSPSLADSPGAWDLTHSALLTNFFPYSFHPPTLFTLHCFFPSVSYFLQFPTLTSRLSSTI